MSLLESLNAKLKKTSKQKLKQKLQADCVRHLQEIKDSFFDIGLFHSQSLFVHRFVQLLFDFEIILQNVPRTLVSRIIVQVAKVSKIDKSVGWN